MNRTDDAKLLRNYVETGSEPAFDQLVLRHFDLVYCSALRVVRGDAHLAQDVAQRVFTDLARKAGRLPPGLFLGGWLYKHTCFTAANAVRTERRRANRERQAAEMTTDSSDSEVLWQRLAPVLDEAMRDLKTAERDAIVLRFFDRQPFQAVGDALGTSEEGARKRVERALEKMRSFFVARGLSVSGMVLADALETHAAGTAPSGLSSIVATAALAGAAKSGGTGLLLLKLITMTKIQLATVALLAGLAATTIIQARTHAKLLDENRILRDQTAQLEDLRAENERLRAQSAPAAQLVPTAPQLSQNQILELARLRDEVGRLQDQLTTARKAEAQNAVALTHGSAASAPEVADIAYNINMPLAEILEIYIKLANETLRVPAHYTGNGIITVRTSHLLTRTEALKVLEDAMKDQAQFTIARAPDGTLVGTPKELLRGSPAFMAEVRTYFPDGQVDPPFPAPNVPPLPPRAPHPRTNQ